MRLLATRASRFEKEIQNRATYVGHPLKSHFGGSSPCQSGVQTQVQKKTLPKHNLRALVGRLVAPVIIFGSPLNSSFGAIILEPPHRFAPEPTLDPPRNAPCTKQSHNAKQSPALPAHPTSHPPPPKKLPDPCAGVFADH